MKINPSEARFENSPSPLFNKAVKALKALEKKEGLGQCRTAFAIGTIVAIETLFQNTENVTPAKRHCIQQLLGRNCSQSKQYCECKPPGGKSGTLWLKDGKPHFFTQHSYSMRWTLLEKAVEFARTYGLEIEIRGEGLHFPSRSFLIVYRRKTDNRATRATVQQTDKKEAI